MAGRAAVADDGDDGLDGVVAEQREADADQHARGVQLAARLSRHVRDRGDALATRIEADFTGTDCPSTFSGLVLTKG